MRVLYVEDDDNSARAVELMLREVGHVCDKTDLGERAIELAKANEYDFLLLDVMLPDIDGYEVIERLRAEGIQIPFLIQSGLVDRDSAFGGLAFGSGEYLVKPFTKTELIGRMESVVARSRLAAGLELGGQDENRKPLVEPRDERRRHRRFKTIKTARIDFGHGVECKIVNLSHGGAAIRLSDGTTGLPPTFDLTLESGETYRCRLCWKLRDKIGVEFLELYE
jgi:DNA-binding response OmpR family regulator